MIAYIARDKNNLLCLHHREPELDKDLEAYFSDDFFVLSDEDFQEFKDVTYEIGPVKVDFNITRV